MDAIMPLIKNVVSTTYEDIPSEAREVAKRTVIDTLGAIIAGGTAPGCQTVADMVREWAGKKEATIIGDGTRVPAPNAVWANATMGPSREIDDCDELTGDHPSVVAVTVALATAELLGGVTGKDMLNAITLGDDLVLRIRDACKRQSGTSPWGTGSYGVFNAAAVAGRLLGLNEEKMLDAMGIAFTQMSNTHQWIIDGALSGRVQQGIAARAGLLSATVSIVSYLLAP